MMICLIGDTHFGVHKNSDIFLDSQIKYIKEQFIPYLHKNNVKKVFFLGDLYDNRSHTNTKVMNTVFNLFHNDLKEFEITILVGNHDTYFNSSIHINSLKNLQTLSNVTLIENITVVNVDNKNITLVPWITDNCAFLKEFEQIENPYICLGHFNILGFKYNKYKTSEDGLTLDIFNKYKKVFSGHFHIRNKQNINDTEVVYIGSPYQLTRNDIDEEKGFVILDTETLNYEFINNTISLKYIQLNYPDNFSKETITGNIIDVYVKYDDSYDENEIQKYVHKIEEYSPATTPNLVIENKVIVDSVNLNINIGSVSELIKEYVDLIQIENKQEIYNTIVDLYNETKGEIL